MNTPTRRSFLTVAFAGLSAMTSKALGTEAPVLMSDKTGGTDRPRGTEYIVRFRLDPAGEGCRLLPGYFVVHRFLMTDHGARLNPDYETAPVEVRYYYR